MKWKNTTILGTEPFTVAASDAAAEPASWTRVAVKTLKVNKHNSTLIRLIFYSVGVVASICWACNCLGENMLQDDAFASFREFFSSKPTITNLIFDSTLLNLDTGKFRPTLLYQGCFQTNGWCIRQLGTIEDAKRNEILNPWYLLAGHYDDTYWVMEGVVKKFNREQINDPSDPQSSYARFGKGILFQVLDFGIGGLDENSMRWNGDEFTATATFGLKTSQKLTGKVLGFSRDGRVEKITYHFTGDDRIFFIDYQYDNKGFDLSYFPSQWVYSIQSGGDQLITNGITHVYAMKVSQSALNQVTFEPGAYMKGATDVLSSHIVIEKDRKLYEQLPGGVQIPVQSKASPPIGRRYTRPVALAILILAAIVPPLLFVLLQKKRKN